MPLTRRNGMTRATIAAFVQNGLAPSIARAHLPSTGQNISIIQTLTHGQREKVDGPHP
jgi:hypothetical protein